jgi:hypothetical protein
MSRPLPFQLKLFILGSLAGLFFAVNSANAQRFVGFSSQVMRFRGTNGTTKNAALFDNTDSVDPTGKAEWQAAILADGDFSKVLGKESESGNSDAPKAGSLGFSFTRFKEYEERGKPDSPKLMVPHLQGNVIVSLGSQGDTLGVQPNPAGSGRATNQYAFGQALLLPGSNAKAARSFTGTLLWRPHLLSSHAWLQGLGYNAFLNITQTRWRYQTLNEDVRLTSLSTGIHYTVFDLAAQTQKEDGNKNSMKFDILLNYSLRHISGDIREESEILNQAFGSHRYWYSGVEPGIVFSVNSLRLSATFPFYQGDIKGFSNGQFIAGLGFSTALVIN